MDNVTHALTGAGLGLLASHNILGVVAEPSLVLTAIVASQLPDLDAVVGATKDKTSYLKHHRGFMHSIFMAPFLALALAFVMRSIFGSSLALVAMTALASLTLHIFLDVFNAYGTKALWPISKERYAWDVLMVVDPFIIAMFVLGIALYAKGYQAMLYALYPALFLYILSMVKHRVKAKKLLSHDLQPIRENIDIMPPMFGWRWWNFIVLKEGKYYLGKINIAKKEMELQEILDCPQISQEVEYTKADPKVQVFLDFARFPYYSMYQSQDGDMYVRWSDLRYKLREKEHFTLWSKTY